MVLNMRPYHVYILRCSDDSYYTGHTDCIERRISEHKQGLIAGYTASRLPVKVVYVEVLGSRYEALAAERRIKGWTRKKKEALIQQDWQRLVSLSNK